MTMETSKFDSIISEILETCSNISTEDKNYEEYIVLFSSLLNNIYSNDFRHSYSNITSTIYAILKDSDNPEEKGNTIINNLTEISKKINNNIYQNYNKLLDHVSLDIQHFLNIHDNLQSIKTTEESLDKLRKEIEEETKKNNEIADKISYIHKETENLNNQLVSILGIFAGIILAFFGGVSIISSSLSNMHLVSRYKIVFVITLIGLIVIDCISILMLTIGKIIGKDLHKTLCEFDDCSQCQKCKVNSKQKSRKFINARMFRKKYPFVIFINAIFIVFIFVDVLLWYFNISHK